MHNYTFHLCRIMNIHSFLDLSRYVDKLIILILTKSDTNLIAEVGNLILKYNFAPNITALRALISTLIHIDKSLARQLYNYAEVIDIYTAIKVKVFDFSLINHSHATKL